MNDNKVEYLYKTYESLVHTETHAMQTDDTDLCYKVSQIKEFVKLKLMEEINQNRKVVK